MISEKPTGARVLIIGGRIIHADVHPLFPIRACIGFDGTGVYHWRCSTMFRCHGLSTDARSGGTFAGPTLCCQAAIVKGRKTYFA